MDDAASDAVAGLAQVGLSVSDLEASTRFYGEVLGLPLLLEAGDMRFLRLGDVRLMLARPEGQAADSGDILYFRVPEMDAALQTLRVRGVEFLGEPHPLGRIGGREVLGAFFRDPEGRLLALVEETEPDGG